MSDLGPQATLGGNTALLFAAQHGQLGCVELLLHHGADPDAGGATDPEALLAAVAAREAEGVSRKEAIVQVAKQAGRNRVVARDEG